MTELSPEERAELEALRALKAAREREELENLRAQFMQDEDQRYAAADDEVSNEADEDVDKKARETSHGASHGKAYESTHEKAQDSARAVCDSVDGLPGQKGITKELFLDGTDVTKSSKERHLTSPSPIPPMPLKQKIILVIILLLLLAAIYYISTNQGGI